MGLEVSRGLRIADEELSLRYSKSSGPGGQNVNKLATKALLRFRAAGSKSLPADVRDRFLSRYRSRITQGGDLLIVSQRFRDAARNAEDCRQKLAAMVRAVLSPPKSRRPTRPTRASKERRLEAKRRQSRKKEGRGKVDEP